MTTIAFRGDHAKAGGIDGTDGLGSDGLGIDGLGTDGLKTRRWNGTKSAFADCALGFGEVRRRSGRPLQRDRMIETMRREAR